MSSDASVFFVGRGDYGSAALASSAAGFMRECALLRWRGRDGRRGGENGAADACRSIGGVQGVC
nr:MAG TPA: hypothetical protein [Caudoviricetes sp.]